jgi:hypothetical protein
MGAIGLTALMGLSSSGFIASAQAVPAAHTASRSCGTVRAEGVTFTVTISRGAVPCKTARTVLQAFMSGKGTLHGPPNGPAFQQTWTLDGWSCGHGTGGGACIRGGATYRTARDYIVAQVKS